MLDIAEFIRASDDNRIIDIKFLVHIIVCINNFNVIFIFII
jgi:hypothetical protein